MRNIIINKEQERILLEASQQDYVLSKVSNKIKNDIATDNTPISCLPIPNNVNKKVIATILTNGYFNARDNFSDDIESFPIDEVINKLDKLVAICQKKEEKIHNELEKLCVDIATSYFNSDELADLTVECRLVMDLSQDDFHIEPTTGVDDEISNLDEYDKNDIAITNRKIANTIVMGGALSLYDKLQETFISELFKLDEDLPHLYSKRLKINEYLTFISDDTITDSNNQQGGCVKVTLGGEEGDEIVAIGTIFPFLLIETFRGYLEFMSDSMLPDNDFETDEITDKADILIDEPWYMMLGRTLWEKIVRGEDDDLTIISELFKMDDISFNKLLTNIIVGTHDAESMIDELHRMARYNYDYADFEKDLAKRREENNLVVDGGGMIPSEEENY